MNYTRLGELGRLAAVLALMDIEIQLYRIVESE